MATRTPGSPRDPRKPEALQAAAMHLVEQGPHSLLYNAQVLDYIANNVQAGNTLLAWYYWGKIPELRYTTRYVSNALSVATLYIGETDSSGTAPKRIAESHPASELLADFAGGPSGQAELLDRLGLHLTVAGDSVLIGPKSGKGTEQEPFDQWRVYSTQEVSSRSGKIFLKLPSNAKEQQIPDSTLPVRIWRPHPVYWWDADSPVKGSFSVLRELDLLDQHVQSSAVSRLAGAGVLGIPEELDLPVADMEIEGTEIDRFVAFLTEVMGLALKNPGSAAARVPIMIRGPGEYIKQLQHFDFSTDFSQQVPELRMTAIRRLALGMDVPPEILLGSAQSTSWSAWQCTSEDTEILTENGWRTHDQVQEGDVVLTLNHETGLSEWQPVLHMFRKEVDTINGEGKSMVSIEGRRHSSLTTWDHKWPVLHARGRKHIWNREWTISADLNIGDRIITAAPHTAPVEAKWSDSFVELVAWFYTEGWIQRNKKNQSIGITQSLSANFDNVALIRRALNDCLGSTGWSEHISKNGKVDWYIGVIGSAPILDVAPDKIVSLDFIRQLTSSQLELFIDRSLRADGTGLHLGQKDPARLEAFELAGILAGYSVGHYSSVHQGFHEHEQFYVSLGKRHTMQPITLATGKNHMVQVDYKGIVWCPTTPNATWCARRNGHVFFTGNTDEATLRVHLIPLLQLVSSSLTVGWLRPMLEELPLSKAHKEQIPSLVVHYDVSNLKIRQDVSGDAQALYDRFEIDSDALRMQLGYSANAAPTKAEIAKQILLKMVATGSPDLVNYALRGLRDNFGITMLPEPGDGEVEGEQEGRPPGMPEPETSDILSPLPDERSQDKQTSPPPVPEIGDNSNNEEK